MDIVKKGQMVVAFPARNGCFGMLAAIVGRGEQFTVLSVGRKFVCLRGESYSLRLYRERPADPPNGITPFTDELPYFENAVKMWELNNNGGSPYVCGYFVKTVDKH